MARAALTVLHVAPHPDDELVAAPATLLALARAGHRVVNLACSLGRPAQHERRLREVTAACERAGFELVVHDPPLAISRGDDLAGAQRLLAATVARLRAQLAAGLVIGPSPRDAHHGHEVVGRALLDGLGREGGPPVWLWGLWASLRRPTLLHGFGDDLLAPALQALGAHAGELARSDLRALVRARSVAAAVQGPEQVFGYGTHGAGEPYAEVLTELRFAGGAWCRGVPRRLDPRAPLGGTAAE